MGVCKLLKKPVGFSAAHGGLGQLDLQASISVKGYYTGSRSLEVTGARKAAWMLLKNCGLRKMLDLGPRFKHRSLMRAEQGEKGMQISSHENC